MDNIQIFCDFDGTITKKDTLNNFLRLYADEKWLEIEAQWENGEIGSRECLTEQMKFVPDMTEEKLEKFLSSIEIDEYFREFLDLIKEYNIDFYIVSDGFDYFINKVLEKNGIRGLKIFSNRLTFSDGKFLTGFPYNEADCSISAGVCKCNIIKKYANVTKPVFYIGDGVSDFCASKTADVLFAKGRLLEYCKKNNIAEKGLIRISSFKDVSQFLQNYKGCR